MKKVTAADRYGEFQPTPDGGLVERSLLLDREVPATGYEIIEQIGSGTYGKVYKVREKGNVNGDVLVLKQVPLSGLSEQEEEDTVNEAQLMIQIEDHPNIVKHHVSFIESGHLHIVMEFCSGGDLSRRIKKSRETGERFSEDFIWQVLIQVCSAIHHLHSHRILHRDVKPENVFLGGHDQAKLGDLGLGRLLGSQTKFAHSTVGTPLYFSPELCEEALYDERSDVWALGCLVYQMATLRPPFLASNQLALAKKIVNQPIRPLSDKYSKDLHFLVHKMLEKNPQNRPDAGQILSYGPVRIRLMQEQLSQREREMEEMYRKRESKLLERIHSLEKNVRAYESELLQIHEKYEHVVTQCKHSEYEAKCKLQAVEFELENLTIAETPTKTPRPLGQHKGNTLRSKHKTPLVTPKKPSTTSTFSIEAGSKKAKKKTKRSTVTKPRRQSIQPTRKSEKE
eukprot:CAMPEP_0203755638 /NCGR_PEP_ID=MMETSP0098-20131031/9054_1 /ASSEMBLY_ACC=CAM_ASM_000208 /TAXON_ID=96639 /ORGANISM=" , Strain NY0313808BC1" /LENGTH=452 /DNA_ID=CAMNT_0050647187 /DNA_START=501 /DNA_END=1856 /DNA_ORIENTATION=+